MSYLFPYLVKETFIRVYPDNSIGLCPRKKIHLVKPLSKFLRHLYVVMIFLKGPSYVYTLTEATIRYGVKDRHLFQIHFISRVNVSQNDF